MPEKTIPAGGTPEHRLQNLRLSDLIDVPAFQHLMDSFNSLTGIPTAILELEGQILTASGWKSICTDFHRKHPASAVRCHESDTVLSANLEKGEKFNLYRCKNGLIDVAAPIIIEGFHLGNVFAGQFLLEAPDKAFFSRQAEALGFDKTDYLKALEAVPVLTDDQIRKAMNFLTDLTDIIGSAALSRKNLRMLNSSLEQQVLDRTAHLEQEKKFSESLISSLPGVMYVFDSSGRFKNWNLNFASVSGYSREEILTMHPLQFIADEDRGEVGKTIEAVFSRGQGHVEAGFVTRSGQSIPYFFTGYKFTQDDENFLIGVGIDISERVQTELEKERLIAQLQEALANVKTLSGLIPICSSCKKIRDDKGYWNQLESFIHDHSDAEFSHGLCPDCSDEIYGNEAWYQKMKDKEAGGKVQDT